MSDDAGTPRNSDTSSMVLRSGVGTSTASAGMVPLAYGSGGCATGIGARRRRLDLIHAYE